LSQINLTDKTLIEISNQIHKANEEMRAAAASNSDLSVKVNDIAESINSKLMTISNVRIFFI
jgi:uncharacterized protein YoxC